MYISQTIINSQGAPPTNQDRRPIYQETSERFFLKGISVEPLYKIGAGFRPIIERRMKMTEISMTGLKRLLFPLPQIVFDYRNQPEKHEELYIKPIEVYDHAHLSFNPDRICLRNNCGSLCFDHIKNLFVENKPEIGFIDLTIVCSDYFEPEQIQKYVLNIKTISN